MQGRAGCDYKWIDVKNILSTDSSATEIKYMLTLLFIPVQNPPDRSGFQQLRSMCDVFCLTYPTSFIKTR